MIFCAGGGFVNSLRCKIYGKDKEKNREEFHGLICKMCA